MGVLCDTLAPGKSLSVIVEDRHGGDLAVLLFDGVTVEPAVVHHRHRGHCEAFAVTLADSSVTDVATFYSDQDYECGCGAFQRGDYCVHLRVAEALRRDGHV